MRAFSLSHILSTILIFTSVSLAWPWPPSVKEIGGLLVRRAPQASSSEAAPTTASASASESAEASATASDSASASGTEKASGSRIAEESASKTASGSASGSGSGTASGTGEEGSKTTSGEASQTSDIDPRDPPGGIQMVTPAPLLGSQYYKIGDYVTFKWNYTSLSVTPDHIDVLASCSQNSQTYTIAMNQTVDATGAVTWDTGEYQKTATAPLLMATYTLIVYDAAAPAGISETPKPGFLGVANQFQFGMYPPQPYTPLNKFKCATCSAALSDMERQALGFVFTMGAITILSFTWFAGGFGVF